MSDQKSDSSKSNIIEFVSRHKENFERYITQYAQRNELEMDGPIWEAALAAAKRLDYSGDRRSAPKMQFVPSIKGTGILGRLAGFFRRREPATYISETDDIRAFLERAPSAAEEQSEIKWGVLRNGFASRMVARLRPGGQQKGSRPTPVRLDKMPGWELLYKRKLADGKKCLYVRGHLLHHGVGGSGLDYNLAPLTAADGGDFGANQANFVHRYLVEGIVLWLNEKMHAPIPTITDIYYEVIADQNRPPRPGTEELRQIAQAYEDAAGRVKAEARRGAAEPTHAQVMNELAKAPPSPHLSDACEAVEAKDEELWEEVYDRVVANQRLWVFEDQNVPLAFRITYSCVENGVLRGPYEETVSIVLPFSLGARFKP
ncbi:MAG: hypothetical protein ACPGWR_23830 [Ardenticatenaceae bacterium]